MTNSSKEAKYKEKSMQPFQRTCAKYGISNDRLEPFYQLIKSHSKKKVDAIKHNDINKKNIEEILKKATEIDKDKVPLTKRAIDRCTKININVIFNAIAAENPDIMKKLADNFHNLSFFCKLNNPEEFKKEWKQKVNLIQSRIQAPIFSILDSVEFSDHYDDTEDNYFPDLFLFR